MIAQIKMINLVYQIFYFAPLIEILLRLMAIKYYIFIWNFEIELRHSHTEHWRHSSANSWDRVRTSPGRGRLSTCPGLEP